MGGAFQAAGGKQQAGSKQHAVRNANQVHACLCVIRNKREVLAANVGGFQGAPPRGEFAFLTENHSGVSGPRGELWHMMEWLSAVRRRQRFLGYDEAELTYLYDIPVW